jgi:gamma-glutamyltranspeptidase/glutathione hydrolase
VLAELGPEALYGGELGEALIKCLRGRGSDLVEADLARFAPEWAAPLERTVGEMTIATAPPNSQGFLLPLVLASAHSLEERLDPLGPLANRLAAVFRSALTVRDRYLCDPAKAEMPDWLLSGGAGYGLLDRPSVQEHPQPPASGDTVAIVAADDAGNSVSLLQSLFYSFGAAILDPETGILVHNRGAFFSLDPDSPNVIAGGKRPAHTLMPCAVFEGGRLRALIGTMGGSSQPQILAEVLLRLQLGDDPERAVAAPRWVVGGLGVDEPYDQILVEGRVPSVAKESLEALDMPIRMLPDFDNRVGHVQLVVSDADVGITAASDPRSEGCAIVVERRP